MDSLINYGGEVKALGDGKVGGYGVTFGGKDLSGEFFTADTYYGRHNGDGVDTIFHHGIPIKGVSSALSDHIFTNAATAVKDEKGIFVEAVLDMANDYEKTVYELAAKGKLGWSSGAPAHMVKRLDTGEITRWVIAEFSLTPTPAEPRNRIVPLKSLLIDEAAIPANAIKTIREYEDYLRDSGFSNSQAVALASGGYKAAFSQRDSDEEQEAAKSLALKLTTDRLLLDSAFLAFSSQRGK